MMMCILLSVSVLCMGEPRDSVSKPVVASKRQPSPVRSSTLSAGAAVSNQSFHIGFFVTVLLGLVLIGTLVLITGIDYSTDSIFFTERMTESATS